MNTKIQTSDSRSAVYEKGNAPMRAYRQAQGKVHGTQNRVVGVSIRSIGDAHSRGGEAWLRRTDDAMFVNYFDPNC